MGGVAGEAQLLRTQLVKVPALIDLLRENWINGS